MSLFVQSSVLFGIAVVASRSPIQSVVHEGCEWHGVLIDAEQQKHLEQCQEALYVEHECAASMELDCGICMEKTFQKGVK